MTTYTVLPQDDLNLEVTVTDPALAPELQDDSDLDVVVQESENPVVLNITPASVSITSAVLSVNGEVGVVTLDSDDIDEGSANLYYTDARATINFDSNFLAADTDDLTEGDVNLYYTDSRARASNSGGTGVTYNSSTGEISIGQDVSTTSDVTFNTVTASDEFIGHLDGSVRFTAKNRSGSTIEPGQVIYISGLSGNTPEADLARSDSSSTMPAFGIAIQSIGNNNNGQFATFGSQRNLNVDDWGETGITFTEGDILYVSATEAGRLTNTPPSGESNAIQNIGKLERATPDANTTIKVGGAGRSNDTPNLNDGNIFIGNGSNQAITRLLDTSIVPENGNLYYTQSRVQGVIDANSAGYIKADSTDTLTNKSGNISQWTNDAGYLTSETDNQTLSFSDPNLTISNGNTVDISAINNIISVNGASGVVTLTTSDIAEGSNKYLTTANVEALDYDSDGGTY